MSEQKDLFEEEVYTVSDVIQGWKDMLNKIGEETNRLAIKKTMMKSKDDDKD